MIFFRSSFRILNSKEYEALQPEHAIIQAIIDARQQSGLTQKELSERTGIAQGDISKLERGNANPSIRTLQRLAAGMGMKLRLEFLPDVAGAVEPGFTVPGTFPLTDSESNS